MKIILYILLAVLIILAAVFFKRSKLWWMPAKNGISVLMYHHVGDKEDGFFIPADMFERQILLIKEKGFNIVSLSQVEQAHAGGASLPAKPVLITFDDGWQDNYTNAYPVLKKHNVPAVIFLSADQIGHEDMLSELQIKEMHSSGTLEFASHGANHKRLRSLTDAEIEYETAGSKKKLEDLLGVEVKSFCYPFGAFDKRVRNIVFKAGYTLDFGTRKGISPWPWKGGAPIKRAHIMRGETLDDFYLQLKLGRYKL
ncbi:Peptidoglycan/xylan/chitin deacetylase [Parelusimicrobium proximum]|uniref:polysaccharide deacetylase family protein n=1 Tax=Parelusimicrobium proximum TaxID=3228953 RepID=UPI003D16FA5D